MNHGIKQNRLADQLVRWPDSLAELVTRLPRFGKRSDSKSSGAALYPNGKPRRFRKRGKSLPAKIVQPTELAAVLDYANRQRHAERNTVIVLLSFKAGLRACEIGGLQWDMIVGSGGDLSGQIVLS